MRTPWELLDNWIEGACKSPAKPISWFMWRSWDMQNLLLKEQVLRLCFLWLKIHRESSQRTLNNSMLSLGLQSNIPKTCNFSYFHIGFLHDLGTSKCQRGFLFQNHHTQEGTEAHRGDSTSPKTLQGVGGKTGSPHKTVSFLIWYLCYSGPSETGETLGRGKDGPRQRSVLST